MAMDNSPVKFRRGTKSNLPEEITDGYISVDANEGQMYADIINGDEQKRLAINGYLFAVCDTPEDEATKTIDIVGVPNYFNGLIVTVIFSEIDNTSSDPIRLSITSEGTVLPSVPVLSNEDTVITGVEIERGVPYMFVYRNGNFTLNSGNVGSRPKWKHISDIPGL